MAAARAVVVIAPPGSGKTTRVPPALLSRGPLLLLQPRRVAARAIARRIAEEQGLVLGEDVGWHVRLESNFTPRTRLIVATEGILTARLVADPLLQGFATVVVDEFHERSVHADLGLALVRQAARARGDLAVVVMSATLDPGPVAAFLGGCPVVTVEARPHPVEVSYAPGPRRGGGGAGGRAAVRVGTSSASCRGRRRSSGCARSWARSRARASCPSTAAFPRKRRRRRSDRPRCARSSWPPTWPRPR